MANQKFIMNVRHPNSAVSVIDIQGELSGFAEEMLMSTHTDASLQGANSIILNFSQLEYMNSSGIGLLVTLLVRAQRRGQRLIAVGLSDHYQHIFELTRLNEAIQTFPTEHEALSSVSS